MTMNKPIPTANERPRKRQLSYKKFVVSKRREQRLARSTNSSKAARSIPGGASAMLLLTISTSLFLHQFRRTHLTVKSPLSC